MEIVLNPVSPIRCCAFGLIVSVQEEQIFKVLTNQKQEMPMAIMFFFRNRDRMGNFCKGPRMQYLNKLTRRSFVITSANQKQEWPVTGMFFV